jgi:phytanoyl-CoA hydroxylase
MQTASAAELGVRPHVADLDAEYYARNGYVVLRGLVPRVQIADLLALYAKDIVPSRHPFFRQSSNAYQANQLSACGYVRQSFLDIHDYGRFPEFSRAARDIFCAPALMAALTRVSRFAEFGLVQTMLFDMNTQTPAHQDWYYLDTVPNGNLIAAWIALEDIDERAGRFYVVPGSQQHDFGARTPGRTHAAWLAVIRAYVEAHKNCIASPALRTGDVLLWNSRTVHGSSVTLNAAYSRKSLTAHYLPGGFEFGNLFSVKTDLPYKDHEGIRYYRNQPDFSQWNRVKFAVKTRAYNHPTLRETLRRVRNKITRRRPAD